MLGVTYALYNYREFYRVLAPTPVPLETYWDFRGRYIGGLTEYDALCLCRLWSNKWHDLNRVDTSRWHTWEVEGNGKRYYKGPSIVGQAHRNRCIDLDLVSPELLVPPDQWQEIMSYGWIRRCVPGYPNAPLLTVAGKAHLDRFEAWQRRCRLAREEARYYRQSQERATRRLRRSIAHGLPACYCPLVG